MANTWIMENIDSVKPTPSPRAVTPVQKVPTVAPVPKPTYMQNVVSSNMDTLNKANTLNQKLAGSAVTAPQRIATAGLGKLAEVLGAPQRFVQNKITGGKGYEDFYSTSPVGKAIVGGAQNKAVQAVLPPAAAFSTPKRAALSSEVALDPLNLVGAGLLAGGAKAIKTSKLGTKIMPVVKAIEKTPVVQKVKDALGAFKYGYGLEPKFLKQLEGVKTEISKAGEYATKVAGPLKYGPDGKELPKVTQTILGDVMRLMSEGSNRALTVDEIALLKKHEPTVQKVFNEFNKLAKAQVKAGVKPEVFGMEKRLAETIKELPPSTGGEIFKLETEMENYDTLLSGKPVKGKIGQVVQMTPDEYLASIPKSNPTKSSIDFMKKKLAKGEQLPMATLDSSGGGFTQEGRNRAYLAKEMGLQTMPVLKVSDVSGGEIGGVGKPYEFYNYQNSDKLEFLNKRAFREDGFNVTHHDTIEAAGDIGRTLSQVGNNKVDPGSAQYIFEKINRIEKRLSDPKSNDYRWFTQDLDQNGIPVTKDKLAVVDEYIKNYLAYPAEKLNPIELKARDLTIAVAQKDIPKALQLVKEIKSFVLGGEIGGVVKEVVKNEPRLYGGKRLFTETYKAPKGIGTSIKMDVSPYMKRQNLSEETRKALGEVKEPAYGAALSAFAEKKNVEIMKFFKNIAKENAVSRQGFNALEATEKAKYVLIPKTPEYGVLAGSYIPKQVAEYIKPLVEKGATGLNKAFESATKVWKPIKTVLSPGQLGRNTITSQIQAFLENPAALAYIPKAIKENITKGKFYKALKNTGEIAQTSPSIELGKFIPEELAKLSNSPKNLLSRAFEAIKKPGAAIQNANETTAKLENFIARLYDEAGKARITIDEALKRKDLIELARSSAEASAFNYQKVSPLVAKLRKGAIPFITYPLKAAGLTAKTLVRHPERLAAIQKGEQEVQKLTEKTAPDEKYLPSYLNQAVRVGNADKKGATPYLNTKYLYPWGNMTDVVSGEGGFNPFTNVGISPSPFLTEAYSQAFKKDIFGKDITDPVRHALETFGPSTVRSAYRMSDALTKNPSSSTSLGPKEVLLKEAGIPLYKYNPQEGASWNQWDKKTKIAELNKAKNKYIRDYSGKKSPEEMKKQMMKYALEIQKISSGK
jgi:hypothetical protein